MSLTPEERAQRADAAFNNWAKGSAPVHPDLAVKIYLRFMSDEIIAAETEAEARGFAKAVSTLRNWFEFFGARRSDYKDGVYDALVTLGERAPRLAAQAGAAAPKEERD